MGSGKRIRRSESVWGEILSRQASSGMSVPEFCRSEGINAGVFRRWRALLNGDGGNARRRLRDKVVAPFIDIGAMAATRSGFEVRLELGSGMVLSIAHR